MNPWSFYPSWATASFPGCNQHVTQLCYSSNPPRMARDGPPPGNGFLVENRMVSKKSRGDLKGSPCCRMTCGMCPAHGFGWLDAPPPLVINPLTHQSSRGHTPSHTAPHTLTGKSMNSRSSGLSWTWSTVALWRIFRRHDEMLRGRARGPTCATSVTCQRRSQPVKSDEIRFDCIGVRN